MNLFDNAKKLVKQAETYADTNKDGKVTAADLDKVKPYADLNKDGKLDTADLEAAQAKFHKNK